MSGFFLWLAADLFNLCRAVSVEADKVPITEENTLEDEEVSLVGNVQRSCVPVFSKLSPFSYSPGHYSSRRLSQKAAYMADTPTRKRAAERL